MNWRGMTLLAPLCIGYLSSNCLNKSRVSIAWKAILFFIWCCSLLVAVVQLLVFLYTAYHSSRVTGFIFTAGYHSSSYWFLYSLLYHSSRVITFSIVIPDNCNQWNLLLCILVGNRITHPTATTRSGRVSRPPHILRIILVRGATRAPHCMLFTDILSPLSLFSLTLSHL